MCITLHHSHNTDDNYTLTQLTPVATITSVANHNITKTQIDSYSFNNKGYTTTLIQQSQHIPHRSPIATLLKTQIDSYSYEVAPLHQYNTQHRSQQTLMSLTVTNR